MRVWCMEIVPVKPLEKYNFLALPLLSRYPIWGNTIWRNTIFSFGETKQSASFNHSPKEFLLPRFCVYNDEVFWSETMIKLAIWVTNLTRFLRITRNVPKISPLSWLTPLFSHVPNVSRWQGPSARKESTEFVFLSILDVLNCISLILMERFTSELQTGRKWITTCTGYCNALVNVVHSNANGEYL